MENGNLQNNIDYVIDNLGKKSTAVIKRFYIGKDTLTEAALIYINGLINKDIIDRDILNPLMNKVNEDIAGKENAADYLSKRYICMSDNVVETDINIGIDKIKRGSTILLIDGVLEYAIFDAVGTVTRSITEPDNETSIKGSREGFIENLQVNISLIRKKIKDKNLSVDIYKLGARTQTNLAVLYIDDVVDKDVLSELVRRITAIEVDGTTFMGEIQQYIEEDTYTVFPQTFTTERPDRAVGDILEGKIAVILDGTPFVMIAPAILVQFFQAVEDYTQRTLLASFVRMLRYLAAFTVITLPSIYLTLLKFNAELIPIKFITPIIQSRIGIALTPFLEIVSMEIVVEFLREGGLRLPTKIAQTLSLVGGIIIGDTAIKSKIVSPTTLLIVGVTVITTFLIPNYDMAIAVRILRFPMLILADLMGIFGIAVGWFFILVHLSSMESFGVPYFEFHKSDLKDTFIRAPLWKMNKRPESIPNTNPIRQKDFINKIRGNKK